MVQPRDERVDGVLKMNGGFPQRVVGVNEQRLGVWMAVLHGFLDLNTEGAEEHRARGADGTDNLFSLVRQCVIIDVIL